MERKEIKMESSRFVWVAPDGTEFNDEKECAKYEKSCFCVLRSRVNDMSLAMGSEEDLLRTGSCETTLYTAVPKSADDLDRIKQLIHCIATTSADGMIKKITPDLIGRIVLVYIGDGNDWVYIDTMDDMVSRMTGGKWSIVENTDDK